MDKKNVAVLIPAYKPDEKLLKLVDELKKQEYTIVIVNDGSGAEYENVFAKLTDVKLISYPVNKGKGGALKVGINYIESETTCTHIITADADGQHTPTDIGKLADFLVNSKEKFVIGSRKFTGDVPFKSKFGNKLTIGAFSLASGVKIGDTQTGLRGFSRELYAELAAIDGDRYEYEINVLLHVAKHRITINEIEIETIYINENASSHFHPIRDSAKIYSCILKYCMSSIASFVIDFILALVFHKVLSGLFDEATKYTIAGIIVFTGHFAITTFSPALARIFSSIFNFAMNKKVVFKSKEKTSTAAVKYFALAIFILLLNSGLIYLLERVIGYTLAYLIVQVALFILNYFIQKKFIFKTESL